MISNSEGMMSRDNILFETLAATRNEVLTLLVEHLRCGNDGFDAMAAIQALHDREEILPTVIAPGVALPHARLETMEKTLVAIATSRRGIVFDTAKPPVNIILLVLTPKSDPSSYLRVLSLLSGALKNVDIPAYIQTASLEDVCHLFHVADEKSGAVLTAADVMNAVPVTLLESDSMDAAITALCSRQMLDIPVIDEDGDLRGQVGMEDLLRQSLPEHLLWMEDLTPILHFEPFAEMMKKDKKTKLADFMREDCVTVAPDTPAVQLAKIFIMKNVRQIQVVEGRRLLGTVNLAGFCTKLFWA